MTFLPRHSPLLLVAAAIASLVLGAGRIAETHAGSVSVQIVEPSILPQSWGYSPEPMTVAAGDTVSWINAGAAPHSVPNP